MTWRRVPPVLSPIHPLAIGSGTVAAVRGAGADTEALERSLSAGFDAPDALLTDSGTSALVLALEACVSRGDAVAMPGYACIDLIAAAIRAGVTVSLYDVDPETLTPDEDSVRATLEQGARALLVAPLYGYPPDLASLRDIAARHGVPLIEDAAQAAGGVLHGRRVGSFGDVTVLSFGRGKGTTGGSGGALLARRRDLLDAARSARARLGPRNRGVKDVVALAAQWTLARPSLYWIPSHLPVLRLGEMVYHAAHAPRAISATAAAVLRSALAADPEEVRQRRAHAAVLQSATARSSRFVAVRPVADAEPGYLRFALREVRGQGGGDSGLGAVRGYPITLDEHPETQRVLRRPVPRLAGALALRDQLLTLPTHSRVGHQDLERLCSWLADADTAERVGHVEAGAGA